MKFRRPSPAMAVAVLALFAALGGAGYAAVELPKNSVGAKQLRKSAVTGKKIRRNAVTSAKVKDRSLLGKDFKAGELPSGAKGEPGPPGPVFGAVAMGSPVAGLSDPAANPDEAPGNVPNLGRHFAFTLPAGGTVYVRFFVPSWNLTCSSGDAKAGLYLDGAPVPKSAHALLNMTNDHASFESVVLVTMSAGPHALEERSDCPNGTPSSAFFSGSPTWTVLLLGT